jgi:hypothetical protein
MHNPAQRRRVRKTAALFATTLAVGGVTAATGGFGLFTDNETAQTPIDAGSVDLETGAAVLNTAVTDMAPGDMFDRIFDVTNSGTVDGGKLIGTLTAADSTATHTMTPAKIADLGNGANSTHDLISDPAGLEIQVAECDVAFTEVANGLDTCSGTETILFNWADITTAPMTLVNIVDTENGVLEAANGSGPYAGNDAGIPDGRYFRVAVRLPVGSEANGNRFVEDAATLSYNFYLEQRDGDELP